MKLLLCLSLALNLIMIGCEVWTLGKIREKISILKYYTFLQNFAALVVSIVYSGYLISAIFLNEALPEYIKGMRYIATCGLTATMFIYVVFLSSNNSNLLSEKDFASDLNPKRANFILHYFCPVISLFSFVLLERQITLSDPIWTGYAAIPSCLYWIIYIIFSAADLWKEPYDFTQGKGRKKNILSEVVVMISIPASFVLISYILWTIK